MFRLQSGPYFAQLSNFIWDDKFWLPENLTWQSLRCDDYSQPPSSADMVDCLYFAAILSAFRCLISRYVWLPLGLLLGLRTQKVHLAEQNPLLESAFLKSKRPNELTKLALSLNMDRRKVESWFRRRRNQDKYPPLKKFVESGWRFCYYVAMFVYGVFVLYDKQYVFDVKHLFVGYPCHILPSGIYWYYVVQLGYYVSGIFWLNFEVKRKDFNVMLLHHLATVALLFFSYVTNFHRIGAVILALHDVADCWMECAKMFKYLDYHRIAEKIFFIFILVWILTRLIYFPFWIIHTVMYVSLAELGDFPARKLFLTFLFTLQGLHIFWFVLILKIAVHTMTQGDCAGDCRSDSELSDEPDSSVDTSSASSTAFMEDIVSNGIANHTSRPLSPNNESSQNSNQQVYLRNDELKRMERRTVFDSGRLP